MDNEKLTDAERAERAAIRAAEIKRETDLEVQKREVPVKLKVAAIAAAAALLVGTGTVIAQCAKAPSNGPTYNNTNTNNINTGGVQAINGGSGNVTVTAPSGDARGAP